MFPLSSPKDNIDEFIVDVDEACICVIDEG